MDEELGHFDNKCWMYRSSIDRRYWHGWYHGVHVAWDWITDDFGNLVSP